MIGARVSLLAKNAEPSTERCVLAGKTRTGPDVGQIENEIVDGILFVLKTGGNRKAFASLEEREEKTAPRRRSIFGDKT